MVGKRRSSKKMTAFFGPVAPFGVKEAPGGVVLSQSLLCQRHGAQKNYST
jgi:hypothetical protein